MTFVDYIIKERSRRFLSISLMDMDRSSYKGTLEEWFSDIPQIKLEGEFEPKKGIVKRYKPKPR